MNINRYVVKSLELHLFFDRIMKEHALFLRAGFTAVDPSFSEKAEYFLTEFENLLHEAVCISDGVISRSVLESGEVITEFTALAEKQTECFTGLSIDKEITSQTQRLKCRNREHTGMMYLQGNVRKLNRMALKLLNGFIDFKETILQCVLRGEMFALNYPLLLEHILREAKLYCKYVEILERDGDLRDCTMKETECFWNQIMMEHAQFVRGLLDPCENELICTADGFAKDYCKLLETSRNTYRKTVTEDSLVQTIKFRDFKSAGAKGIQQNNIRSIILPLLADHVLREANHYIRLLQSGERKP